MIELPFEIIFDLDFLNGTPKQNLLNKLENLFSNIYPNPVINIYFKEIDENFLEFVFRLFKKFKLNVTAQNPSLSENFLNLIKQKNINIKIDDDNYDLSKLSKYNYNLILPFKSNLYEYLKTINKENINKITINHCKNNVSYDVFKKQLDLICKDNSINYKCNLLPYLEESEQKKFYSDNGDIRPFLSCSALWVNPVINYKGKITLPCYCSENSINEVDFFDLWDCDDLNNVRQKLINLKQFEKCKYCEKFYKENFFIVENGYLDYKNKKFYFDNVLNPTKSAPIIGIAEKEELCYPIPFYSDDEIINFQEKLLMLIK